MSPATTERRITAPAPTKGGNPVDQLRAEIKEWWQSETDDWDSAVANGSSSLPGGADLWDRMPAMDSKAAARSSPIFKKYFGTPLDPKLLRPGGYSSPDDMLDDLIPKMQKKCSAKNKTQ